MIRGRIAHIFNPLVIFCDVLGTGVKMKNLKAGVAPKL